MKLAKNELIAFFLVIFLFILVESKGITHTAPGDENVYYYMAKSVAEGQLPYRDFFYAHPPLHILILALVVKIFGLSIPILKSAELLVLVTGSFFLFKLSLEFFRNRLSDKSPVLISTLALILFLFSFEVMFKATFGMGTNMSLMFMLIAFYFLFTKKYFIGGIFSGLAGLTRFYTLAPLLAFFAFILFEIHKTEKSKAFLVQKIPNEFSWNQKFSGHRKSNGFSSEYREKRIKDFLNVIFGFLLTFGLVITALTITFGQSFIEPVFKYHLLKPELPSQKILVYKNIFFENLPIILTFLLSIFIKDKKKFAVFYLAAAAYLLFLLFLNTIFEFYFIILFPFIALVGAYGIVNLMRRIKIGHYVKYGIVSLIIVIFLWSTAADAVFLEKIGFSELKPLSQMTEKISETAQNEHLFGDDSIVPLLALLADRKIALNFIDANEKRFTSGLTNFYIFTNQLDDVDISYIIFRKNKGLHQIIEFRQYAEQRCKLEEQYSDAAEGVFLFYKC